MLDDASEDEPEELFPDSGEKASAANRETKKEREEKLKKMMEEEDADGKSLDATYYARQSSSQLLIPM